jgi:hypothetical protein
VKRREFITLLGGAAAWPLAARAQQTGRMRRVGVLMTLAADDPEAQARIGAFLQGMQEFGWTIGRNLRIDYRWASDLNSVPAASLAHPGGNATGSSNVAPDLSAKLLGTFAQLVPGMSSVGVMVNPANPGSVAQMDGTQQVVHALGLQSQWSMQVRWKNTSAHSRVSRSRASTACYCSKILPTLACGLCRADASPDLTATATRREFNPRFGVRRCCARSIDAKNAARRISSSSITWQSAGIDLCSRVQIGTPVIVR